MGGGAGNGVPIAVGIVSLEELVEGGCEIGHWRCLCIVPGNRTLREIRIHLAICLAIHYQQPRRA